MEKRKFIYICVLVFLIGFLSFVFAVNFDFNNDGIINITDLQNIASHYHGKTAYNSTFDLNNDSVVNLFDIVALARNISVNSTGPTYPNLPAGLTVIGDDNGSIRGTNETGSVFSGQAFGFPWATGWYWDNTYHATEDEALMVVNDSTNPTGSGKALRFNWSQGTGGVLAAETDPANFSGGPYGTLYIMLRMYWDSNWTGSGHKFFYVGLPQHAQHFYVTREIGGGGKMTTEGYAGAGGNIIVLPTGTFTDGTWQDIEWVLHAQSAPGVYDGTAEWYVDGNLVGNASGVNWNDGDFGDFEWYATSNSQDANRYYRIGELYIAAA